MLAKYSPARMLSKVADLMTLDADALQSAQEAFDDFLRSEAKQQNAYLAELPDGRVSLELEWLDVRSVTRAIIAAYLSRAAQSKNSQTV